MVNLSPVFLSIVKQCWLLGKSIFLIISFPWYFQSTLCRQRKLSLPGTITSNRLLRNFAIIWVKMQFRKEKQEPIRRKWFPVRLDFPGVVNTPTVCCPLCPLFLKTNKRRKFLWSKKGFLFALLEMNYFRKVWV